MFDQAPRRSPAAGPNWTVRRSAIPAEDLATEAAGVRFTEGSVFLCDYVSSYDSELVKRLRRAGLMIVGKTNTPEFGMSPTCEPCCSGQPQSVGPHALDQRVERRIGGGGRVGHGARGSRQRPGGRFASLRVGAVWPQADPGPHPLGPEYGDAMSGWAVDTRSPAPSATAPRCSTPCRGPAPRRPVLR